MPNRRNTVDDDGRAWYSDSSEKWTEASDDSGRISEYAVDDDREEVVMGPYGSREYARTCAARSKWPNDLSVARSDSGVILG